MYREQTYFTPRIEFEENRLRITGRLWMENPPKYFEKINLNTINCNHKDFYVELNVEHINSSSIKQLLSYFNLLKQLILEKKFNSISIEWNISNDDLEMLNVIKDLEGISELSINIGSIKL